MVYFDFVKGNNFYANESNSKKLSEYWKKR